MKRILIALSLVLPAACLPQTDAVSTSNDDCGASDLVYLVGKDGKVLDGMRFAGPVRILEFGQPMTMDLNPARLNIQKNRSGKVARVWCG